jgi:hypothetical protein
MGIFREWMRANHLISEAGQLRCPTCGMMNPTNYCVVCDAKFEPGVSNLGGHDAPPVPPRAAASPTPAAQAAPKVGPEVLQKMRKLDLAGLYTDEKLLRHFGSPEAVDYVLKNGLVKKVKHSLGHFTLWVQGLSRDRAGFDTGQFGQM